mgnify:CR=1 FL=1
MLAIIVFPFPLFHRHPLLDIWTLFTPVFSNNKKSTLGYIFHDLTIYVLHDALELVCIRNQSAPYV